jgi:hypothetical protein
VAKSLQGLANMSTFGNKEEWMEPMNAFLQKQRNIFKEYIDTLCDVSSTNLQVNIPPSYSTPLAILNRLPTTSREGFPSLPHLIDHARSFAALVSLWLDRIHEDIDILDDQPELLKFHTECLRLRKRTEDCLSSAERAARPSSQSGAAWEDLLVQYESESANADQDESGLPVSSASSSTLTSRGYSHSRVDSTSTTPTTITSTKRAYPPILGIRSTSQAIANESPLASRQQWRGPARQLSLEILPTSRAQFARDQAHSNSNKNSNMYDTHQTASPASNATSPFGNSPFGGSDGSADELPQPATTMSKSGRTTPNFARNTGEHRVTPWSFSTTRELTIHGSSKERKGSTVSSRSGNSRSTSAAATNNSTSRRPRGAAEDNASHDSSDGGAGSLSSSNPIGNAWRSTRAQGERLFHKHSESQSQSRPESAGGFRGPSSASTRQHLKQQAELMEPGESYYGTSPKNVGLAVPRAPTPSRLPRKDWASEERKKREQRTAGLSTPRSTARPNAQIRAYSDDGAGYNSTGDTTGEDELGGDDDHSMTALPSIQKGSKGERGGEKERDSKDKGEKKMLLKEMIFKKRKPQG